MAVKFMIDSASDVSKKEAQKLGVIMVPMTITFDTETYLDGVYITSKEFYEKLIESDVLPKTSQINSFIFEEEYEKALSDGDQLIVITISSKLSATNASAVTAAEKFGDKVFVVDSLNAAIGERLLLEYGLLLREQGKTAKEIFQTLQKVKSKINVIALVDTLEYLKKGGRISSATAFAGSLLSIKPVVAIQDGEVKLIGKAMGSKKGNNLLCKLVEEKGGIDFDMPFGTIWSGIEDSMLQKYVKDSAHLWESHTDTVPSHALGGTIGTHVGPGVVGVAFFQKG